MNSPARIKRRSLSKQGRQPAADAQIQPHTRFRSIFLPHPLPLFFSYHLQCQLVMVAQENAPLAVTWELRVCAPKSTSEERYRAVVEP